MAVAADGAQDGDDIVIEGVVQVLRRSMEFIGTRSEVCPQFPCANVTHGKADSAIQAARRGSR